MKPTPQQQQAPGAGIHLSAMLTPVPIAPGSTLHPPAPDGDSLAKLTSTGPVEVRTVDEHGNVVLSVSMVLPSSLFANMIGSKLLDASGKAQLRIPLLTPPVVTAIVATSSMTDKARETHMQLCSKLENHAIAIAQRCPFPERRAAVQSVAHDLLLLDWALEAVVQHCALIGGYADLVEQ